MKTVDYRWPPERIVAFCEKESDWILEIPKSVLGEELAELYRRHGSRPARYNPLIAAIAEHGNPPADILNEILAGFSDEEEIASALATNPNAPRAILEALTRSAFESVRGHAELHLRRSRA